QGEPERRGFVNRAVTAVVLTLAAMLAVIVALLLVAAFPVVMRHLGLGSVAKVRAEVARWLILVVVVGIGDAVPDRWGPDRRPPTWHWITWGTAIAVAVLVLGSVGFSIYVNNFGHYNKVYGSLAAVIVLMLWLYLSAFAILLGADVDAVRDPDRAAG